MKPTKSSFAKLKTAITFGPAIRIEHIAHGFRVEQMRSTNIMQQKVAESLGLVLVPRHQNWPNLVLAKLQTAITFGLAVRIGHIVYGFAVQNEIYESGAKKSSRVSWFGPGCTTPNPANLVFAKL